MADSEQQTTKPTPFTILLSIYNARLVLDIPAFSQLSIEKQCEYLQSKSIRNKSTRKELITKLTETEKECDFSELSSKSFIRIRVKNILSQFHKESNFLASDNNISTWSSDRIILSFIAHLVTESDTDTSANKKNTTHPKIWEFVDYLRRYYNDVGFDGQKFVGSFDSDSDKPTKGFGLKITKAVVEKFGLKSGPFAKVKKPFNAWALKLYNQSQSDNNVIAQKDNFVHEKPPHNYSKFVTDVSMFVNEPAFGQQEQQQQQQQPLQQQNDSLDGKKWYWFNDMSGLQWTPYRDVDCKKLTAAWMNGDKQCNIIDGNYRVEFNRNSTNPGGNQYNNRQNNAGGRTVVCSVPQKQIHGVDVGLAPL